jgi:hypothetical protein
MFFVQFKQIKWKFEVPTTSTLEVVFHIPRWESMLSNISLEQIAGATVSNICYE